MFKLKIPKKVNYKKFFENEGLAWIVEKSKQKKKLKDYRINNDPHLPDLKDLYFLYQVIRLNNRTTILEYGCGWSTLIMHLALMKNKRKNYNKHFARCGNPYELHSVDGSKKFLKIAKKRVESYSKNHRKIKFFYSEVNMTKFNGRYCTEYKKHPLLNPDFIYLDAPHQWVGVSNKKIENFTTKHHSMMPMACDILKFEHFLTPGTIIITDGRTANARFLKANFQRNWKHIHMKLIDQHYFYLDEKPLGKWNEEQINFYNKK
jgi:hypothetical protein